MIEFQSDKFLRQITVSQIEMMPKVSILPPMRNLQGVVGDVFIGFPVTNDWLKHFGVLYGDVLIVKTTKHFNEANLYIWFTPDGIKPRFAEMSCTEIVLHDGEGHREKYLRSDVEMFGVVVRVERDLKVKR